MRVLLGAFMLLPLAAGTANAAPLYSILDLGTLGGNESWAGGRGSLNAAGEVTGGSLTGVEGEMRAFRTAPNAAMTAASDLGTLGGTHTFGIGINNAGQVVGRSYLAGDSSLRAFRTGPGGVITPASNLGSFGGDSSAYAVNASGQAVGYSHVGDGSTHRAFRTAPGGTIDLASDLGTFGGANSQARDINDLGQVVGFAEDATGTARAF